MLLSISVVTSAKCERRSGRPVLCSFEFDLLCCRPYRTQVAGVGQRAEVVAPDKAERYVSCKSSILPLTKLNR